MKDKVIKRLRFDNIQSEVFDKSEYNDGVFKYKIEYKPINFCIGTSVN